MFLILTNDDGSLDCKERTQVYSVKLYRSSLATDFESAFFLKPASTHIYNIVIYACVFVLQMHRKSGLYFMYFFTPILIEPIS